MASLVCPMSRQRAWDNAHARANMTDRSSAEPFRRMEWTVHVRSVVSLLGARGKSSPMEGRRRRRENHEWTLRGVRSNPH
jgi:hypothetical protein